MFILKAGPGTGEMAQRLRAIDVLYEDSDPSTHMVAYNYLRLQSKGFQCPVDTRLMQWNKYIQEKKTTQRHKINKSFQKYIVRCQR